MDNPELLLKTSKEYINLKNYTSAIDILKEYLVLRPEDEEAQNLKIKCEYILRRQGSANQMASLQQRFVSNTYATAAPAPATAPSPTPSVVEQKKEPKKKKSEPASTANKLKKATKKSSGGKKSKKQ